ncbi:hypothetical protein [Amycolatopsis sp. YIM 10]|uniref:hypothetical protein n=1 Tax=Amycolatopsis sp. YIM 10 TaxID=2653857 RepID=UPI0012904E26|nr:hypothetical protein [Amycolatopsis sp. YIM 10]QFU92045.1 hypothetical protein YIM_34420 [Amycolatopsis sp. YIM 10]
MTYGPPDPNAPRQHWDQSQGWPGGLQPAPPKGPGFAVAALLLGLLGLVLPFIPADLTGIRQYVGLPFAVAGLALGVIGCIGRRRGLPVAVIAVIVSTIALGIGLFMVVSYAV